LDACGEVDAVALHAYSSNQNPDVVSSPAKMGAPFSHLSSEFWTYRDFLLAMPSRLWSIPIYITEANPGARGTPWQNVDTGWCNAALDDVASWNAVHPERAVRCLAFYSWSLRGDGMGFSNKSNVQNDILRAAARGIEWPDPPVDPEPPDPEPPDPEPPDPEPTECLYDLDEIRRVVQDELEEVKTQLTELRAVIGEELRKQLDKTVLKVQ